MTIIETQRTGTDNGSFEDWYRDHHKALVAWCARFLSDEAAAADVAQEALLRAWIRRDEFADPGHVRPWLWRVARNLCIDTMRSRKRLVPSEDVPERFASDSSSPDRPLELEEERATVRQALSGLSERHRELLYLRDVKGVAYEDLAAKLGVSVEGARAVLFRARRCLQHQLKTIAEGAAGMVALARLHLNSFSRRVAGLVPPVDAIVSPLLQPVLGFVLGLGVMAGTQGVVKPVDVPAVPVTLAPAGHSTAVVDPARPVRVSTPSSATATATAAEVVPVGDLQEAPTPPALLAEPHVTASVNAEEGSAAVLSTVETPAGTVPVLDAVTYRTDDGNPSAVTTALDTATGTACGVAANPCDTLANGVNLGGAR